jgi:hypothetical protein
MSPAITPIVTCYGLLPATERTSALPAGRSPWWSVEKSVSRSISGSVVLHNLRKNSFYIRTASFSD